MREWIEQHFGARVVTWAEPTDCGDLYEVVTAGGSVLRADSVATLIVGLSLRSHPTPPRRLLAA